MKTIMYRIKDFEHSYMLRTNRMNHELTLQDETLNFI
jgi:hypothetical protein